MFIAGFAALLYGASKLTDTSAHIAHSLGIHPIIIGMTIISVGTSIPEMANSAISMATGVGSVALGDIIGSDLVQITLILGVVAFIRPIKTKRKEILFYGAAAFLALLLALILLKDGVLDWKDGLILCLTYVIFLIYIINNEHITKHPFKRKHNKHWLHYTGLLLLGFFLVFIGSRFLVHATVSIAKNLNVPAYLIAFIAVGLGTSLPELFVAATAAYKKNYALSVGTLLGSNITDPTLSLGFGALFTKGALVSSVAINHMLYLVGATVIIVGLLAWKKKLSRPFGAVCVLLYIAALFLL